MVDSADAFALHVAAADGNFARLSSLIRRLRISTNVTNFDSVTLLHEACLKGNIECVLELIQNYADVNARNIDGSTPLCEACAAGNVTCVKILLKHGAGVNPPLLLITPLHEAAISGHSCCAELLLQAGANVNSSDCHYGTPLHAAVQLDNVDCAITLLKYGADVNATQIHKTAIHLASINCNNFLIGVLIDYGADIYAKDNQGRKASDMCPLESDCMNLLKYYEANPQTLLHCCKLKIRNSVKSIKNLQDLGLPSVLLTYIQ